MQSALAVVSVHKPHKILTCWADGFLAAHIDVVVMHLLQPAGLSLLQGHLHSWGHTEPDALWRTHVLCLMDHGK